MTANCGDDRAVVPVIVSHIAVEGGNDACVRDPVPLLRLEQRYPIDSLGVTTEGALG